MSNIIFSIIVPIHGVEEYLDECLSSLCNQTFNEQYEVICVLDDASKTCENIVDKFCQIKPEVFKKIIVNLKSISYARNSALKIAKGSYIGFVDGDDFVSNNFLLNFYNGLKETGADIACCNYYQYKNKKKIKTPQSLLHPNKDISTVKARKKLLYDIGIRGYVWNKVFKSSILTNLSFINNNLVVEDLVFSYSAFLEATSITFIKCRDYFYRIREQSAVKSIKGLKAIQMFNNSYAVLKNQSDRKKQVFDYPTLYKDLFFLAECFKEKLPFKTKVAAFKQYKLQIKTILNGYPTGKTPWDSIFQPKTNKKGQPINLIDLKYFK